MLAFFIGLIIFQAIWPKLVALFVTTPATTTTGLDRLSASSLGQSTYRRFYEWYKALVLFTEHPFFGVGWYQYPREGIYIMQTEQFSYIPMNMNSSSVYATLISIYIYWKNSRLIHSQ